MAVDLLFPILQCANAHLSNIFLQILDKKDNVDIFGLKVILAFYVVHFAV